MKTTINFTRINNDINGNPRYVCHFLELLGEQENKLFKNDIRSLYEYAVKKSHKISGKRFSNKQYSRNIIFQSYNIYDLEKLIISLRK